MNKFSVVSLFPTPVGRFEFPRPFTKAELNYINKIKRSKNEGNYRSVDSYVLKNLKLKGISEYINTCVGEYFRQLFRPIDDVDIYVTQSWFNYSATQQYHHRHGHPNSYFSGVLYINAVENLDSITFHADDEFKRLKIDSTEVTYYNSIQWTMPVKTGVMYIFPSHLQHSVGVVKSDQERVSLAFNTFLKGKIGNHVGLTELILE